MTVEIKSQVPDSYKYGWYDKEAPINQKRKGLSPEVVREISQTFKHEPDWMLQRRLKALKGAAWGLTAWPGEEVKAK